MSQPLTQVTVCHITRIMNLTTKTMNKTTKITKWKNLLIHHHLILHIQLLSNHPSLTQTSTLSLPNSKPPTLFLLFLHTFVALFLLQLFPFFPTSWIASTFTSVSQSFDLQTQLLDSQNPCIETVRHHRFQQKGGPKQYPHTLTL